MGKCIQWLEEEYPKVYLQLHHMKLFQNGHKDFFLLTFMPQKLFLIVVVAETFKLKLQNFSMDQPMDIEGWRGWRGIVLMREKFP